MQEVQSISKTIQKRHVGVILTNPYLNGMQILIKDGIYMNQSEIMKDALRRLLLHYNIALVTESPIAG